MCSSVISSRTPHRMSTTWAKLGWVFCFQFEKMKILKCPDLVLQSVLLTTILLDLGVDIFHQCVPLHQHVSEGGTGEDTNHLWTNQTIHKSKKGKKGPWNKKIPLNWEVATRPNFQQIFYQPSPHLWALPVLQKKYKLVFASVALACHRLSFHVMCGLMGLEG